MRINRHQLRALVESVLLEGFKDDQRYLVEKYPDHTQDLEGLGPKWISWLTARFGERPKTEETHPFEDAIVTIVNFSKRDAGLSAKYAAPGTEEKPNVFKASVDEAFPPKSRSWKSPADATTMTVDEMEEILGLSERKKERFENDVSEEEMESDRVGKVGPWNLWMPTTRERSCRIAGYDPVTRRPKTTWCTARMAGSNLFYSYIGQSGTDMTLFYIIRDNPKQDRDWLSLGFVNGKPSLKGEHGGVSVNRANNGLTPQKLKAVLRQHHDEIMRILTEKNKSLGGKHPARQKIKDAARNVIALRYLTQGLSKTEAADLKTQVLREPEVDLEVLQILTRDEDPKVRAAVAGNSNVPAEVLQILASDKDPEVKAAVAWNSSAPAEVLQTLARETDSRIRSAVAWNRSTPTEVLQILARETDSRIRNAVAANPNASAEVLQILARETDSRIRNAVAANPNTSAEVLETLARDEEFSVRSAVARNENSPAEVLQILASDKDPEVKAAVAWNSSAPAEVLETLASDKNPKVRAAVAGNRSAPTEVLQILAREVGKKNKNVRSAVAWNPSAPAEVLQTLTGDEEPDIRYAVAVNPNASAEVLQILARDEAWGVRFAVARNKSAPAKVLQILARDELEKIRNYAMEQLDNQGLNEARLRQLIRQML